MAKAATQKVVHLSKQSADEMTPYASETAMPMKRIKVIIDGRTPLLTHNPEAMGQGSKTKRGSRIPEPEDEAEAGCYRMEDGALAIKGEAPRGAILGAASAWKMKNRATMKSALSHITIVEELIPLLDLAGNPLKSYEIDRRRAIVVKQGIIRSRPKFNEWSCTFTIEFDPAIVVEPRTIVEILADAGGRIGVGDFRPARNGWFGRFAVRSYAFLD
jgi:hypothetical protein